MNHKYVTDWSKYPNFSENEFKCSHTDKVIMVKKTVDILQQMRTEIGESLIISSAYRHSTHPIEARKAKPGAHSKGLAVDIKCFGKKAHKVMALAFSLGIDRIGINQKGPLENRFIHIDTGTEDDGLNSPWPWSY